MKNVNAITVNWLNIMNKYADASLKEKIADCKRKGSKKTKKKQNTRLRIKIALDMHFAMF